MKTILYLPLLLCSVLFFSCKKDSSNPQTSTVTTPPGTVINITITADLAYQGYLYFGLNPVSTATTANVIILNPSTSNASLSGSVAVTGTYFSLMSGGPNFLLLPGTEIDILMQYKPLATGNHYGYLTIKHNATTASSPITIPLYGQCR